MIEGGNVLVLRPPETTRLQATIRHRHATPATTPHAAADGLRRVTTSVVIARLSQRASSQRAKSA